MKNSSSPTPGATSHRITHSPQPVVDNQDISPSGRHISPSARNRVTSSSSGATKRTLRRVSTQTFRAAIAAIPADTEDTHPQLREIHNNAREVGRRAWGIRGTVHERPVIDNDWLDNFDQDVWDFLDLAVRLPQAGGMLATELSETHDALDSTCEKLSAAETELDESRDEIISLKRKIEQMEYKLKAKQDEISQQDAKLIAALKVKDSENAVQIKYLQEKIDEQQWNIDHLKGQVENKRNIWREMHPNQQNPYDGFSMVPPAIKKASHNRTSSSGRGHARIASVGTFQSGGSVTSAALTRVNETGSPSKTNIPLELDIKTLDISTDDETAWTERFTYIFKLTRAFCELYFTKISVPSDQIKNYIAGEDKTVWGFMRAICKISNSAIDDSQVQVLLGDNYRVYFMTRIMIQYIIRHILSAEGWAGFSETVTAEISNLDRRLQKKTVLSEERQQIVDRLNEIHREVFSGARGEKFKKYKFEHHLTGLEKMVAPLTAVSAASGSGRLASDLKYIASECWDLSGRLWRSGLTFQYVWDDPGARFSADSHQTANSDRHPAELMRKNASIKLATTPAVIIRSDQGLTIQTKQILKSNVVIEGL
ncbi:hypothetical protein QBC38DRAFT_543866 [Podospora fimiseda]|uniref:Uncharacterized protein n=1 Tax=Podospora fimiseda TaxID=252190 RepID=A0AAN7BT09_9PEZI|nr:hypothetical protein QBC38DRAFT_543866 [Podospora fimiseda]